MALHIFSTSKGADAVKEPDEGLRSFAEVVHEQIGRSAGISGAGAAGG
jgi:glycerate kinase